MKIPGQQVLLSAHILSLNLNWILSPKSSINFMVVAEEVSLWILKDINLISCWALLHCKSGLSSPNFKAFNYEVVWVPQTTNTSLLLWFILLTLANIRKKENTWNCYGGGKRNAPSGHFHSITFLKHKQKTRKLDMESSNKLGKIMPEKERIARI